jgi:hypothetical protein
MEGLRDQDIIYTVTRALLQNHVVIFLLLEQARESGPAEPDSKAQKSLRLHLTGRPCKQGKLRSSARQPNTMLRPRGVLPWPS